MYNYGTTTLKLTTFIAADNTYRVFSINFETSRDERGKGPAAKTWSLALSRLDHPCWCCWAMELLLSSRALLFIHESASYARVMKAGRRATAEGRGARGGTDPLDSFQGKLNKLCCEDKTTGGVVCAVLTSPNKQFS
jgi:hypothetical protein